MWFKSNSELFKVYFLARKEAFRPLVLKEIFLLGGQDISRSKAEAFLRASKEVAEARRVGDAEVSVFLCGLANMYGVDITKLREAAFSDDPQEYETFVARLKKSEITG